MRVAVVTDVHGNRHAFEAVLESVVARGCTELWSLGDLVGYGAEPDACVDLARTHATVSLAGNHDLGVSGAIPLAQFSEGAAAAAIWTRDTIRPDTLEYLRGLESARTLDAVALYHASPRDPIWEYVLSVLQAELCLDAQDRRVSVVGHSHVALYFARLPGVETTGGTRSDGPHLERGDGEWLLNPGSGGQPRDGDPRGAWLELDVCVWTASYHRIVYDIAGAMAAIRAARLPESLAERLQYGQ